MSKLTHFPKTGTIKMDRGDHQILLQWKDDQGKFTWKVVEGKELKRRGSGELRELIEKINMTDDEYLFVEDKFFDTTYPLPEVRVNQVISS